MNTRKYVGKRKKVSTPTYAQGLKFARRGEEKSCKRKGWAGESRYIQKPAPHMGAFELELELVTSLFLYARY